MQCPCGVVALRYFLLLRGCRVTLTPALARRRFRLAGKSLSFSLVRDGRECVGVSVQGVAKRNGGGLVGMVCLVGSFAKETICVAWFFRERTPLGVHAMVA